MLAAAGLVFLLVGQRVVEAVQELLHDLGKQSPLRTFVEVAEGACTTQVTQASGTGPQTKSLDVDHLVIGFDAAFFDALAGRLHEVRQGRRNALMHGAAAGGHDRAIRQGHHAFEAVRVIYGVVEVAHAKCAQAVFAGRIVGQGGADAAQDIL